ncbi:hypothetical protein AXG93_3911s1620 [Marchantia polymorpha subsp. ruderalis]|uniref:Vacuolar membrane protease n=1 Tax=Marchantia polymorpha subsp. ruderalis TaxID=1480154 RepID=A0A176W360_MARPO|nr:hypothetical protein AXG93_3911s1620 [Marchantia polymorpha subsp. ruderalis]
MVRQRLTVRTRVPGPRTFDEDHDDKGPSLRDVSEKNTRGAAFEWLLMLVLVGYAAWVTYYFQVEQLPPPLSGIGAGIPGFAEERAYEHVFALSNLGPHPVGTSALDDAIQSLAVAMSAAARSKKESKESNLRYVYSELMQIKESAHDYVDVEVEVFSPNPGLERMTGGVFFGKSLVYTNLKHLVVRISPSDFMEAKENAILVSSHIDTVITSPGAGDCSSCVGVMLELVRALSHRAHRFKHSVIFLFNTGEEEGLVGAHSFITQHPWTYSIRAAIDIEAMGIGGKSLLFQAGPDKWLLEMYKKVAKYPSAQILAQDVFHFGLIKSATDFQVYVEVGGLSGLDFAHVENGAIYHTKNDRSGHLRPGSLQPIGRDLLVLLDNVALSDDLPFLSNNATGFEQMETVYFDILGFILLISSLYLSGLGIAALIELGLAILTIILTWTIASVHVFLVAVILPHASPFPIPYITHSWLAVGLFGVPAVMGALIGHSLGRALLKLYIAKNLDKGSSTRFSKELSARHVDWHAERWLFKAGLLQWMVVLGLGTWIRAGSSYIALFWIIPPAVVYGLMEAQFSPKQNLRALQRATLWLSMIAGVVVSAVPVIRLSGVLIGNLARFDRNPGSVPLWTGNALTGGLIAVYVCLTLVYLLPFAHRSGGLGWILAALMSVFVVTMGLVITQVVPAFNDHVGRALNVVHVVDTVNVDSVGGFPSQKISISAGTPGGFEQELNSLQGENFTCGKSIDFVSHYVKSGCEKQLENDKFILKGQPMLNIEKDKVNKAGIRVTSVRYTTGSSIRWNLAFNTTAVQAFKLETSSDRQVLVPGGAIEGVDGWHNMQFISGETQGPNDFYLTLYWHPIADALKTNGDNLLLKLRTDVNLVTPELERVLMKLPTWCALFGKSTAPYPLTYLAELKV